MNSNIIIPNNINLRRSIDYSPYGDRMGIYCIMRMTYDIYNK